MNNVLITPRPVFPAPPNPTCLNVHTIMIIKMIIKMIILMIIMIMKKTKNGMK